MDEDFNQTISYYEADFTLDILQLFEDYFFLCKEMIKENDHVLPIIEKSDLTSSIFHNNFKRELIEHIKANEDFYIDRLITHFKELLEVLKSDFTLKFIVDNLHDQFGIEEFNDEIYEIIKNKQKPL